jgi:hypothetical protein
MAGQTMSFRPSILNLLLYAGDGFSIRLACKDPAGAPIDITGAVTAQVRLDRIHPDDPPLASFTVSLVDAYIGIVGLTLTGDQTLSLLGDNEATFTGVWDVQWTPVDMEPRTLTQGTVECVADVTR